MCLLRLPEKEKRYQSGPTYWKTNFSLSLRKENLSPQEFALRAEQRLETAPRNCTAMLSQIREALNMPTDNKQLLRLKRMSKSPHWGGEVHNREEGEIGEKMLGGGRYRWEGIFFKGAWGIWRTLWSCDPLQSPGTPGSPGMRLPSAWLHLTKKVRNQPLTHFKLPVLPNILSNLLEALTLVYSPTHVDTSIKTRYVRN